MEMVCSPTFYQSFEAGNFPVLLNGGPDLLAERPLPLSVSASVRGVGTTEVTHHTRFSGVTPGTALVGVWLIDLQRWLWVDARFSGYSWASHCPPAVWQGGL